MQKRHSNLRDIVNHIISVSDLGRGKASKWSILWKKWNYFCYLQKE